MVNLKNCDKHLLNNFFLLYLLSPYWNQVGYSCSLIGLILYYYKIDSGGSSLYAREALHP